MGEAFLHQTGSGMRLRGISATLPTPYNVFYPGQTIDISHAVITADFGRSIVNISPAGCTVSPAAASAGMTSITISFTSGGVKRSTTVPVTVLATSSFANTPWEVVAQAAYYGFPKHLWQPGDTKTLTIGGTTHTIRIIGFDNDPLDENDAMYSDPYYNGGTKKASLALQWYTPAGMIESSSELGDSDDFWRESRLRTEILPALLASMPNAVKNSIRTVDKFTFTLVSINGERIKKHLGDPHYDSETIFLPSYFDTCYMNTSDLFNGVYNYMTRFDKPYTLFAHEWGDESDWGGYIFGDHSGIEEKGEMVRNSYPPNSYSSLVLWRMLPESEAGKITPINPRYSKYGTGALAYFPVFNL